MRYNVLEGVFPISRMRNQTRWDDALGDIDGLLWRDVNERVFSRVENGMPDYKNIIWDAIVNDD